MSASGDGGTTSGHSVRTPDPIRVLVVDDHPTFVRAVSLLLTADGSIEVIGSATNGADAIHLAIDEQPDVVLMDLNMPGINGIDATEQIVQAVPHVAVIVLTMFDDDDSVVSAIRRGARGYLLKGARQDETQPPYTLRTGAKRSSVRASPANWPACSRRRRRLPPIRPRCSRT